MNERCEHYSLFGDVTQDDANEIQRLLAKVQCPIKVSVSERRAGGFAYSTPDLLITAAAVASVLNCIWNLIRGRPKTPEQEDILIGKELNEHFMKFEVVGLQVEEIYHDDRSIVLGFRDIPQGSRIEIEIDREERKCTIRRSKRKVRN
jgi:hypothetical protein